MPLIPVCVAIGILVAIKNIILPDGGFQCVNSRSKNGFPSIQCRRKQPGHLNPFFRVAGPRFARSKSGASHFLPNKPDKGKFIMLPFRT